MKSGWKIKEETIKKNNLSFLSRIMYAIFGYQTKEFVENMLLEKRQLPQGGTAFEEWSDRIIAGALIEAEPISLKYALANMIMHLGPTESHKEDAFFIHQLKKSAANQVANSKIEEYKEIYKAKAAEKEKEIEEQTKTN
jgi:hypothetical protein